MVWIEAGTLIAGTPLGSMPRIADQELPGTSIPMQGFFIDIYNYPGESGALPRSGLSWAEAKQVCTEQGKRLCTELEWERACKGQDNRVYGYGDSYEADACGMGLNDSLAPNGANPRCRSSFGVRDMHGSAYNWTASRWGRGATENLVSVRGGNGRAGELLGRCANARPVSPSRRDAQIGVRCCAGKENRATVQLRVTRGRVLQWRPSNRALAKQLEKVLPREVVTRAAKGSAYERFRVERIWIWRPLGNEELLLGGGCSRLRGQDQCGVVIVRPRGENAGRIAFVSSDWWIPTIGEHDESRRLYLYGGDQEGAFRLEVVFDWGRIRQGKKFRKKGKSWFLARP
jgi:formylglycine-generating enzyme